MMWHPAISRSAHGVEMRRCMLNRASAKWVMWACAMMLGASGCAGEDAAEAASERGALEEGASLPSEGRELVDGHHADHRHHSSVVLATPEAVAEVFDEEANLARLEYPDAFQQVGWMMDADSLAGMEYRVARADGSFSKWEPVEVYWNEGRMFNARVRLNSPAHVMELRGFEGITFAEIEFFEEVVAPEQLQRPERPLPPEAGDSGPIGTRRQASVAPSSLVIPRSEWGAINPGKICGSVVAPYRASIHHTYAPSGDGGDAAARVRQMQSYHINTRGWCDIGYHFIVSQAGNIYQGRSRSDRPGAHVGNQNSGNVGISFIADFTTQTPSQTQLNAGARMLKWVHETHGVPMTRTAVKGHREWPGQSTSCPGGNMISSLETLLQKTRDLINPPAPQTYEVALDVTLKGGEAMVDQGSSEGVVDALPGAEFSAEILLKNASSSAIRGVRLGYAFDELGLTPLSYTIESDHPGLDQSSWSTNDAMQVESNPEPAQMGSSGELVMNAFSAGESKRVVVTLRADSYSFAMAPFGGVRAFVTHIDDVYAQSTFDASPGVNRTGTTLRAHAGLDIFATDAWFFEGPEGPDVEGWTAEGVDAFDEFRLNTSHGLLALHLVGEGATVSSPAWTAIDADAFPELVLRARSHDGEHVKAVYWSREGEAFSEERSVRFEASGDGEYHDLIVNLSEHPEWSGEVKALRIALLAEGAPGEEASGWYDVDHIYFQNRAAGTTTTEFGPVIDQAAVALLPEGGGGEAEPDGEGGGSPGLGANDGEQPGVRTASGCATTGQQGGGTPAAILLLLGWVLASWRRRAT
ncbi:hypothetical protein EA187_12235 [Lujinxingia sediminis]|uniref:N-acetylmuramoyl-L-alanine amidase n=2 Tax=Lujinxingia sediminis TaxID=2480984 RepID=A0ABY0CRZ9_9DELT|nr:hypothetical protein EA187_12235 [Lujinxingia sediminis]